MYCTNCGAKVENGISFCKNCGEPVNPNNLNNNTSSTQNYGNNQSMNQNYYNGMNQTNSYKRQNNNDGKIVLIVVIAVVAFLGLILFGTYAWPKIKAKLDNNVAEAKSAFSTYKVTYSGYTFSIPVDMEYDTSNERLDLANKDQTKVISIGLADINFDVYTQNLEEFKNKLRSTGYNIQNSELKNINGKQYLVIEGILNGDYVIAALTSFDLSKTAVANVATASNYDYDLLNTAATILTSGTQATTSSIKVGNDQNSTFDIVKNFQQQ